MLLTRDGRSTNGEDWGFDTTVNAADYNVALLGAIGTNAYVISAVPLIEENFEYPVCVRASVTADLTFSLDATSTDKIYHLKPYLKDLTTQQLYDFENPFVINIAAGTWFDKYSIVFKSNGLDPKDTPVYPSPFIYIDWGDGTIVTQTNVNYHSYSNPGEYIVRAYSLTSNFEPIYTYGVDKILEIISWGTNTFDYFNLGNCVNLVSLPKIPPIFKTSPVLSRLFYKCNSMTLSNLHNWIAGSFNVGMGANNDIVVPSMGTALYSQLLINWESQAPSIVSGVKIEFKDFHDSTPEVLSAINTLVTTYTWTIIDLGTV